MSLAIIICLSGLWLGGLLYISFSFCFLKLVCYVHVFPCICSHPHSHAHTLTHSLACAHTHSLTQTLSSISVSLILSWESRGVRVEDLDTSFDTGSFSGRVIFFTIVGLLTTVYAVVMVVIGLSGVKMPAIVVRLLQ